MRPSGPGALSLLWPNSGPGAYPAAGRLGEEAIADLRLDEVIAALVGTSAPAGRRAERERYARRVLTELVSAPEVIAHRQAVLTDLLDDAALRERLAQVLPALDALGDAPPPHRYRPSGDTGLERLARRLGDLEVMVDVVVQLLQALQAAAARSPGLRSLERELEALNASETFRSLQTELPALRATLASVRSVTIGVNIGADLSPESATILGFSDEPIEGRRALAWRLLGGSAAGRGLTPLQRGEAGPLGRPNELVRDLRHLMGQVIGPIQSALDKYGSVSTQALSQLGGDLGLLVGAARLVERLRAAGLPMCCPIPLPAADRAARLHDTYDLGLALSQLDTKLISTTTPLPDHSPGEANQPAPRPDPSAGEANQAAPLPDHFDGEASQAGSLPDHSGAEASQREPLPDHSGSETSQAAAFPDDSGGNASHAEPSPGQSGDEAGQAEPLPEHSGGEASQAELLPGQSGGRASQPEPLPDHSGSETSQAAAFPNDSGGNASYAEPSPGQSGDEAGQAELLPGQSGGRASQAEPQPDHSSGEANQGAPLLRPSGGQVQAEPPGRSGGRASQAEPLPGYSDRGASQAEPLPGNSGGEASHKEPLPGQSGGGANQAAPLTDRPSGEAGQAELVPGQSGGRGSQAEPRAGYSDRRASQAELLPGQSGGETSHAELLPGQSGGGASLPRSERIETGRQGASPIVTNPVIFDRAQGRVWVLTGPNRGGKTTYTRAVGLAQVLFQAGLYVPGRTAQMSPVDTILTHFPTREDTRAGLGRLDAEAERLAAIFRQATPRSLILLNEALAGTSALEALDLARGIVRGLRLLGARAIYVTHLHELASEVDAINATTDGDGTVASLLAEASDDTSAPSRRTYRIHPGAPRGASYAAEIAEQHGISFEQLSKEIHRRRTENT